VRHHSPRCGAVIIRPRVSGLSPLFRTYLGALWLMVLFLILVVALDWTHLTLPSQVLFGALTLSALYIGWRGWQALERLRNPVGNWQARYSDDVGFTLIALFDGFAIIGALDLGAPLWLVIAIGVLGVLAGRLAVRRVHETAATA
jgi:hypothetical protein